MKKMNLTKAVIDVGKMKKQFWFKPLSFLLLCVGIVLLVLGSAFAAKVSAENKVNYNYADNAPIGGVYESDVPEDGNTSNDTRNGLMVTLGNLYDKVAGTSDREVVITGDGEDRGFYQGDAGTLETMELRITGNVLSEMKSHYSEVLQGAAGKDGAPGEKGEQGEKGDRGSDGAVGKAGNDGQTGSVGATGSKGDTGPSGADGLSTYIAYADTESGNNMGFTPKETSKFIGTYQGRIRSNNPKDYQWMEYKDKIISYENDGKPTLKIFN